MNENYRRFFLFVAGSFFVIVAARYMGRLGGAKKAPNVDMNVKDHPPGNTIPIKTIQPFKKISDYMFSPWDPTKNAEKIEFLDAENMPRTDYIMPGGARLVTHGFTNHVSTGQPAFPVHGAYHGKMLSVQTPIRATTVKKNLNHHTSIWHGNH